MWVLDLVLLISLPTTTGVAWGYVIYALTPDNEPLRRLRRRKATIKRAARQRDAIKGRIG